MMFALLAPGLANASDDADSPTHDYASDILEESQELADKGNEDAAENVRVLSAMSAKEKEEFNNKVAEGDFDSVSTSHSSETPQATAVPSSLQVTATCDQNFQVLGVNLITIRLTGTYYSSQMGAVVDRTTATNAQLIHSYDPTVQSVDFSNESHNKVNNSLARFTVFVNVQRGVGPVQSNKSGTMEMTANGYQVVQSCGWI